MENFVVIEIDGQQYGFKFTLLTLEMMCEKNNLEYHELLEAATSKPFSVLNMIFQAGYERYHDGKKSLDKFTADDLIERMDDKDLQKIWNDFEMIFTRLADRMQILREGPKKK
jgi:hypothetical protein